MADIVLTTPFEDPSDPCALPKQMANNYIAAEAAVLRGQTVQWGERRITRASIAELRSGRQEWERKYADCVACQKKAFRQRFGGLRVSHADLRSCGSEGSESGSSGCCG